jgi:hypothetical protein
MFLLVSRFLVLVYVNHPRRNHTQIMNAAAMREGKYLFIVLLVRIIPLIFRPAGAVSHPLQCIDTIQGLLLRRAKMPLGKKTF